MNIFEFFLKLTHPPKRFGWVVTTAHFTGAARTPKRARGGYYPLMKITPSADFREYEIRYFVGDRQRTGWYIFYPGPDPEPDELPGMTIKIRYKRSRPWIFENISGSL